MKVISPQDRAAPLSEVQKTRVEQLVRRQRKANGVLMKVISFAGSQVEDGLGLLPAEVRKRIDVAARSALEQSYHAASRSRQNPLSRRITGDRANKTLATVSGALGGLGGLPTAIAELPVATTVIFRAVQDVAEQYGEDPLSEETRIECLRVFGTGGPGTDDDGIDTSFIGARVSLTGPALNGLINKVAPRFAAVLSQKLASQAVPVIGAAAGAGTNYAFIDYYVEMAHVHFGLRQMTRHADEAEVLKHFHQTLSKSESPIKKA